MTDWQITRLAGALGAEVCGLDLARADAEAARAENTELRAALDALLTRVEALEAAAE